MAACCRRFGADEQRQCCLLTGDALSADNFVVGAAAVDTNYDIGTGALYYDADGSGTDDSAVQFANVYASGTTAANLTAAEFVVI